MLRFSGTAPIMKLCRQITMKQNNSDKQNTNWIIFVMVVMFTFCQPRNSNHFENCCLKKFTKSSLGIFFQTQNS